MNKAKIQPIYNDDDLKAALKEIRELWGSKPGTENGDRLQVLATLVEAYEDQHHSIPLPDPIEAIKLRLEQRGIPLKVTSAFFIKLFGSPSKASEVLNRHRALSLPMIRRIHKGLDLPLEILVQEVRLKAPKAKDPAKAINLAISGKSIAAITEKEASQDSGGRAISHKNKETAAGRPGQTYRVIPVSDKAQSPRKGGRSGREDTPRAASSQKAATNQKDKPFKGVHKGAVAAFSTKTGKVVPKKKAKGVN